jgi:hypothetical protein
MRDLQPSTKAPREVTPLLLTVTFPLHHRIVGFFSKEARCNRLEHLCFSTWTASGKARGSRHRYAVERPIHNFLYFALTGTPESRLAVTPPAFAYTSPSLRDKRCSGKRVK